MNPDQEFQPDTPTIFAHAPTLWPWVSTFLAIIAILLIWGIGANLISRDLAPGPTKVIQKMQESWQSDPMITMVSGRSEGLAYHTFQTSFRFLRSLSSGLTLGCLLLFLACLEKRLIPLLVQLTWIANPIPPLLLLPIVHAAGCSTFTLEWAGGMFYPTLAVLSIGLRTLAGDDTHLEFTMRQAGAGSFWLAANVRWPAIESTLLPSLKTHGAFTLGINIVVEWLLAPNGLGQVMKYALSFNSGALLLSAVVLVVVIATIYETLVYAAVSVRLRWKVYSEAF